MINCNKIKFLSFCCFMLFNPFMGHAQVTGVKITEENPLKQYTRFRTDVFNGDAVILKDSINEFNRYPHAGKQYIPSLADIKLSETILKTACIPDQKDNEKCALFPAYFKKFKRQYSGCINETGDTIVVVVFLDFSNKRKAEHFFKNWLYQNEFLGSGLFLDSRPPKIYTYSLNLKTRALAKFKI